MDELFANLSEHARFEIEAIMRDQPDIPLPKRGITELMILAYIRGATFMRERVAGSATGEHDNG